MAGFAKVSSETMPARPLRKSRGKKDASGKLLSFKSSRVSLLKRQSSGLFQSTSISKHYELNRQVYEAFRIHYDNLSNLVEIDEESKTITIAKSNFGHVSNAFCMGWNFVETALLELPTHGYFYSNDAQIVKLRKQSSAVALEVTRHLQRILKLMNSFEDDWFVLDVSSNKDQDPNVFWLLNDNRDECKRRLATLKNLAKEQINNFTTYESKHKKIVAKWTPPKQPSTSLVLDCEPVGETLMSCLCPTALPEPQETPVSPPKELSSKSLADEDTADEDSDCAVLEDPKSTPQQIGLIQKQTSDDAVVDPPPTKTPLVAQKREPTQSASNERQEAPSREDNASTSTTSSIRRRLRIPKKKQAKNSAEPKKGGANYGNRLFGKKTNAQVQDEQHQHYRRQKEEAELREALYQSGRSGKQQKEEDEFQEALYQSELEAAKAASMRDEETKSILSQYSGDYSTCSSGIYPPENDDLDLQQAIYLSELEAACKQSFEGIYDEEKRDDWGDDGRFEDTVTDVIVPAPPMIVKGIPVPRGPPGAIYKSQKDLYDSMSVVKACCRKDFERLREQEKVAVSRIATYQGRIQDSTNGCTVIAPLLCARYFETKRNKSSPLARLSDEKITEVIDSECPSLLPAIRTSLGVSKNAFLIPHDAHEHLIESKHMSRDQFVTVCGGNILEEGHLGALIKELSTILPNGKKLGATFFFHQHVIAILQLRDSKKKKTSISFDIIDSLPSTSTLPVPSAEPLSPEGVPPTPNCARIYCNDAASLKATLKWYACSVFTPENERYIDDYHWDEKLTDFDPRVFQAFVWKEI